MSSLRNFLCGVDRYYTFTPKIRKRSDNEWFVSPPITELKCHINKVITVEILLNSLHHRPEALVQVYKQKERPAFKYNSYVMFYSENLNIMSCSATKLI